MTLKPTCIRIGEGNATSAFFPDGKTLAVASGKTFALWDLKAGHGLAREQLSWDCSYLALTGTDSLVVNEQNELHFWDHQQKQWSTKAIKDSAWLTCVATSANGGIMARGHQTGTIEIRQAETGALLATLAGAPKRGEVCRLLPRR